MESHIFSRIPREYLVPGSIVLAGILISFSIVGSAKVYLSKAAVSQLASADQGSPDKMAPINAKDHVFGAATAPITLVMYSDTECPFCKVFHEDTIEPLMDEYGVTGKVRFVYRHFPLVNLHPKAIKEAVATECAAKIGGAASFWTYLSEIFNVTPSNNKLEESELPKIASRLGIDVKKFSACLEDEKMIDLVKADYEDALATGGQGTPWSILVDKKGNKSPVNGALPLADLKAMLDEKLK